MKTFSKTGNNRSSAFKVFVKWLIGQRQVKLFSLQQHPYCKADFGDAEVNPPSCYRKLILIKVTLSAPFLLIFPFSLMIETY